MANALKKLKIQMHESIYQSHEFFKKIKDHKNRRLNAPIKLPHT